MSSAKSKRTSRRRPATVSGSGVLPDIELDDLPLLDHAGELRLGRSIQSNLRRLGTLIKRHPKGYREVVDRLLAASRGEIRIVVQGFDRGQLAADCRRALDHLGEFERSDIALSERIQNYLDGVHILDRYPLEPEFAIRLGRELGGSGSRESSTCIRRLENVVARVTARVMERRDALTRSNERLVVREALKYRPRGLRESDLYQEGFIGLQKATLRFDAGRNLRFSTYATFWVRQAIRQSLINQSRLIRVPQRKQRELRKWQAGDETRLNAAEAERVSKVMHRTVTFSFAQDEEGSMTDFDRGLWQNGPSFAPGSLPTLIERGLKRLSDRQRRIVQRRFGLDGRPSQTLESIGQDMQLSRERVRQLELEAMRRLRNHREFEDAYESVLSAS